MYVRGFFLCVNLAFGYKNSKLHKSTKNDTLKNFWGIVMQKVIHNETCGFIGKNELYTELFTLSTENPTNFAVYIVKKPNDCFVQMQ